MITTQNTHKNLLSILNLKKGKEDILKKTQETSAWTWTGRYWISAEVRGYKETTVDTQNILVLETGWSCTRGKGPRHLCTRSTQREEKGNMAAKVASY